MYFAVIFIFILSYDAFLSFFNDGRFGVGVGTFVLTLNPILLGCYTFGCHSIRHFWVEISIVIHVVFTKIKSLTAVGKLLHFLTEDTNYLLG